MFELLAQSIWGYPIIGAVHVLGIAWFAGTAWGAVSPPFKRAGAAVMLASGLVLFALHPALYLGSRAFRIKIVLLVLVCLPLKLSRRITLALWVAIIFASRGIAFF
jgi:hypothetical protein